MQMKYVQNEIIPVRHHVRSLLFKLAEIHC